jgi:predicted LPLAT superfamily acyltransferase
MSAQRGLPEWRRRPERGSRTLLRIMAWLSLRLGRACGRPVVHGIAAYFFLFAPTARRDMRNYLRRALGREPRAGDRYRLILSFATVIHDRLFMLTGHHALFEVSLEGEARMREVVAQGGGALLFGAHMGSFEVLRAVGARRSGLDVAMAMYEDNARKLNAVMAAAEVHDPPEIIALGHVDAMLKVRERLDRGALVGVLADRTLGDEATLPVSFLGATARLPLGPMRAAALLRRRVFFMLGLYRGGCRYHLIFEPLADFSNTSRSARTAAVETAVRRFGSLLEQHCRSDPYNWFNFFDFWSDPRRGARTGAATDPAWP